MVWGGEGSGWCSGRLWENRQLVAGAWPSMWPPLPCHRGSSLRIFSIMAWLAAPVDWPSMLPSTVVWPFCKASMAWSSLRGEQRRRQSREGA